MSREIRIRKKIKSRIKQNLLYIGWNDYFTSTRRKAKNTSFCLVQRYLGIGLESEPGGEL